MHTLQICFLAAFTRILEFNMRRRHELCGFLQRFMDSRWKLCEQREHEQCCLPRGHVLLCPILPDSSGRNCYRLPLHNTSSLVLVRSKFVYKNYDGLAKPPVFSVSLGTAIANTVNLAHTDPWIEEFVWPVSRDVLPLCFHSIPNGGFPVISSIEVRPLPPGAYTTALGDWSSKLMRKAYRINCGYVDGPLR